MEKIGKKIFERQVITYQLAAFMLIIALIWFDEFADIPHYLFGAEATPVNWKESLTETLLIIPIASIIIYYTKVLFQKMKYLEGLLPICSSCKNIRDAQGNWQSMEAFIHDRSEARFSHGLCPKCAKKLYPEVFTENISHKIKNDTDIVPRG